ncbi:MAG: hypothetical protein U1F43_22535 [Myxococcota bacterium]
MTPLIVGDLPEALAGPLRVGRWRDVLARLGDGPWPEAALAACCALTHRAPRVVLARPEQAIALEADVTLELAPLPRDAERRPRVIRPFDPSAAAPDPDPAILYIGGRGRFVAPGRATAAPISAASLAFALMVGARSELLPTVALDPAPDALPAGVATLRTIAGRVRLPPGLAPAPRPSLPDPPPRDPLAAALEALVRQHAFRVESGPSAFATLRREADRILKEEVRARRITAYALAVGPGADDDGPVAIEVHVRLPRRVRQVIFRIGPIGDDGEVHVRSSDAP